LGTDLHAPLGQNRPAARRRSRKFSFAIVFAAFAVAGILGLSLYAMRGDDALKQVASNVPPASKPEQTQPPSKPDQNAAQQSAGMPRSDPNSGANIERTLTDDGSVVTKYTPRSRDGSGPVMIGTQRIGQDPRMAAQPNDALLENSPHGRLPIVGPGGQRPMDQYARPWSGARGTRIAIVVGGLGLSQTGTQRAIRDLPPTVTLAFAVSGNSLQRWMQDARRAGHEILIQVPFEPFDYPANDPGPGTLLTKMSAKDNLGRLHQAMGEITNYTGVMNYLGGRFLANPGAMEPVLRDIGKRGLLFLDDGSSAQSKSGMLSKTLEVPHAFADIQLDGELQQDAILRKLDELERIARRNGSAIGVASAFDESVDAISKWSEEAAMRGIEVVAVSALAEDPKHP
jgi:polysaccharide deacetylase 2 family uncharacterized protein YibQ